HFNQTSDDPIKREIFQNRDFRIALSYAINRPQLIEALGGNVEATQPMPTVGSVFYDEEHSKQYTEYNLALANEHLDKAGYTRNQEGWRVGPDGNRIEILAYFVSGDVYGINTQSFLDETSASWAEIGIYMTYEALERLDFDGRYTPATPNFNQYDVLLWNTAGGYDVLMSPTAYLPVQLNYYAPYWGIWYENPQAPNAVEPPADVKRQFELYDQILATADEAQQTALMAEIVAISADQFNLIGTVTPPPLYGILRPNFHNVPQFMYASWSYPNPAPTNPCQYYKDPQS
nr:ABC transporter substrate-binding protein [Anaerolineae bacterium]